MPDYYSRQSRRNRLELKLLGGDSKGGGDFLAGGLARLGDCFLLGKRRL
jgi:hypothetical protein